MPGCRPHAAKLLLTHLGFLSISNQRRHRIVPLAASESLLRDLEKLDAVPERESVKVAVLFARSGHDTVDDMVNNQSVTQEFSDFLLGLGWPVDVSAHIGIRAGLEPSICDTSLYFATRNVEAVFHVPYLLRINNPPSSSPGVDASATSLSGLHAKAPISKRSQMRSFFHHLAQDDLVYIIWMEDPTSYLSIPKKIGRGHLFIFVHPMPHSSGLYLVRLHPGPGSGSTVQIGSGSALSSRRAGPDDLHFVGPLTDGMVVSRQALSALIRATAIAGHGHANNRKSGAASGYRRPHFQRGHEIESIINRHKNMAKFFTGAF